MRRANIGRNRNSDPIRSPSNNGRVQVEVTAINAVADSVVQNSATEDTDRFRNIVATKNEEVQIRQGKVLAVLRECTDGECGDSPSEWWNWWDRTNESIRSKTKAYQYDYNFDPRKP